MEEDAIIASILRGNSQAFGILMNRYTKLCFSIAYRVCQDAEQSQDIVQDSFISAYENLKEFNQESKFSTWLYRITLNKALAYKKKQKFFESADELEMNGEETNLEFQAEDEKKVKQALSVLNEKERLIIDLYYYQDQSIREISVICQITEANVKVIMHRSRKKMSDAILQFAINL
jgi:RNA polymerase sigma factor (sigma-70 family)